MTERVRDCLEGGFMPLTLPKKMHIAHGPIRVAHYSLNMRLSLLAIASTDF